MTLVFKKIKITTGVYWVEVPEIGLKILCGCPADAIKHIKKRGLTEEVESNGFKYETGPNAILLSDVLIQNGSFANLTEFPLLHILYLQGMLIPGHPNNTGERPLLIGHPEQVNAQLSYFYRGNYGLVSEEEIIATGTSPEEAREIMRLKLRFAFGSIKSSEELVETRPIAEGVIHLKNGLHVERTGFNVFTFYYKDQQVEVDLNLAPDEKYQAAYQLGHHLIKREYFSVIHSGEGDGWDINRPCMASVLTFQGKIYLVDAGPNIMASLNYLGISVNEIEGIFHTHAHDDHFAGLTTLIRTDHRFKYFATPVVRASVTKKLSALMSIDEENFHTLFEVHDLAFDEWQNVNGLEVKPVFSPHPIETNIFFFRARWQGAYKTYAHLGDVASLEVLSKMITGDPEENGVSIEFFNKTKNNYLAPADLKKIDIGAGMIHGEAEDYREDTSAKIVLAHTHKPLTQKQREIGSSAAFGMVDVLIPAQQNYLEEYATQYLRFYFPSAPDYELKYLLNHPIEALNAGSILIKKGKESKYVYLLLTGTVEYTDSATHRKFDFSAGSIIGFYAGYTGLNAPETYLATSNINVLKLPSTPYNEFIARNNLYADLKRLEDNILFLESTWLFGEVVSFPILTRIAQQMSLAELPKGGSFDLDDEKLVIVKRGKASLRAGGKPILTLENGDFCGGEFVFYKNNPALCCVAERKTLFYVMPLKLVLHIPVVYWKLMETYEKRLKMIKV